MQIKAGIDLISLLKFKRSLKNGGEIFLKRVFVPQELGNTSVEHLAGIFAAKEAVMKALDLPADSWRDVEITHDKNGAPQAKIRISNFEIRNYSLSISHDGNYVIAQFVAILK